ncbi:CRISPR-associated helicase Cas3' [Gloeobacter morelensis MG652769]|uniref:CRISPR-associated helicase Cas3 n=2 Tax=Gloeobacter TaxID=33071 RepID=A0ABY3PTG9_9CYAN|nr:CRISPR-associated helicase Cas3' [Gloeobacter morelensis MG652769]
MNQPAQLLAKSRRSGREPLTLEQHLLDTELAALKIFRLDGRWGKNWCRFFKIQDNEQQQRFLLHLRLAALWHDIGKANEDFLKAVSSSSFYPQLLRHEHLSAFILHTPEVRRWMGSNLALNLEVITAAVLSHHLKAEQKDGDWTWGKLQRQGSPVLRLHMEHPEVQRILERIAEIADLSAPPTLSRASWSNDGYWQQIWRAGKDAATEFRRQLRKDSELQSLLLATKAGLIAADAVASGVVRVGCGTIEDWVNQVVHARALQPEDIVRDILHPRGEQIARSKGKFELHPFQKLAALRGSRLLLLAGCGVGKTLAAWKWTEEQARLHQIGRVIFLYPTRGTATEGFKDYVGWAPEADGTLLTGTSEYELEQMLTNPSDATKGKKFLPDETQERLFALGFWPKRYFSATVDQFLSFLEHSYSGVCLLPALADSAVIIDEVHSFDRQMFRNLVSFLQHFEVPVLCMTATLSKSRREELRSLGLQVFPDGEDRKALEDLNRKEEHLRYRIERHTGEPVALQEAQAAYRAGQRVLWVVNTVDRCQRLAKQLSDDLGIDVLTYHSRFTLQDRQKRHAAVVGAFKQIEERAIAVTTQVCEMSLDLDADMLISELAPIPALVQRAGRANRHLARGDHFLARILVYAPEGHRPYTHKDLEDTRRFLNDLGTAPVSQLRMAELLEKYGPEEAQADGSSRFVESGYYAVPGSFRDEDDFTLPCVLSTDLDCEALQSSRKRVGYLLNVPKKFAVLDGPRPNWLPKYIGIADGGRYSAQRGFRTDDRSS